MCTVSIIAKRRGYLLAMNRDETLSRAAGLPPKTFSLHGRKIICPSEPGGGTWIALNALGVTFALINWYSVKAVAGKNPVSRGVVVNAVAAENSAAVAGKILAQLPLGQINPFRLIGVFPATREIFEWRWDQKNLHRANHSWRAMQFISSGLDEPQAQRIRSETFRAALKQKTAGTRAWLGRLHRSHAPARGPFSTCMHRADAATVSCTKIIVTMQTAELRHHVGAPCEDAEDYLLRTPRRFVAPG